MKWKMRLNYRFYMLFLCLAYFTMLYIFHGNLQVEISVKCRSNNCLLHPDKSTEVIAKIGHDYGSLELADGKGLDLADEKVELRQIKAFDGSNLSAGSVDGLRLTLKHLEELNKPRILVDRERSPASCYLPSNYSKHQFASLEPDSFVYSAYYDDRYSKRFVRIMTILSLNKQKRKLNVFCQFNESNRTKTTALFYEMCENHGKQYGGFLLSCEVPEDMKEVCFINVTMEIVPTSNHYVVPPTRPQTLPIMRLPPKTPTVALPGAPGTEKRFKFTICIPPLFGNIATEKFVEFIELSRILGFQHFIIYTATIDNKNIIKALDYYQSKDLVTVIDFTLPSVIQKSKIWYNGQLSAHNDCLYRAMQLTKYVALLDIDEFIVPHNGQLTINDIVQDSFKSEKVCGLSFDSAFFDSKFMRRVSKVESYLVTQTTTGRSEKFSNVRTKVLVRPERIFEVGIHHISKPAQEGFNVVKVNTSIAYLHHYRSCVPNYGMKCNLFLEDLTMLKYGQQLEDAVENVFKNVFDDKHEL